MLPNQRIDARIRLDHHPVGNRANLMRKNISGHGPPQFRVSSWSSAANSRQSPSGAIYGQLAGAYYGVEGIPTGWRECIALDDLILEFADGLLERRFA